MGPQIVGYLFRTEIHIVDVGIADQPWWVPVAAVQGAAGLFLDLTKEVPA
jgi:hypothetical protein